MTSPDPTTLETILDYLNCPRSEHNHWRWALITEALEPWYAEDPAAALAALPEIEASAAAHGWADHHRVLPGPWLEAALAGEDAPLRTICRVVNPKLIEPLASYTGNHTAQLTVAQLDAILTAPALAHMTCLRFDGMDSYAITPELAQHLVDTSPWPNLHTLVMSWGGRGDEVLEILGEWQGLAQLRTLHLYYISMGKPALEALLANPRLGELRHLHIQREQLHKAGAKIIAQSPALASLESLTLKDTKIGKGGIAELLKSPHLGRLRSLCLDEWELGAETVKAITGSKHLVALERLELEHASMLDADVEALLATPKLHELRHLNLSRSTLTPAGLQAIADAPCAATLETLDLWASHYDDATIVTLNDPARLPRLRHVKIKQDRLSALSSATLERVKARWVMVDNEAHIDRLIAQAQEREAERAEAEIDASAIFGEVRSITQQAPGRAGFKALCALIREAHHAAPEHTMEVLIPYAREQLKAWPAAHCAPTTSVQDHAEDPSLALVRNLTLSHSFARALSRAHLGHIERLKLDGASIEAAEATLIGEHPALEGLRELHVDGVTRFGTHARHIARAPACQALERLTISSSTMTLGAFRHFWHHAGDPGLRALSLSSNRLDDRIIREIVESERAAHLRHLTLKWLQLTDEGLRMLADCAALSGLETLTIEQGGLTEAGLDALRTSPHLSACALDLTGF